MDKMPNFDKELSDQSEVIEFEIQDDSRADEVVSSDVIEESVRPETLAEITETVAIEDIMPRTLSPDGSIPTARLPPDGHEHPVNYTENHQVESCLKIISENGVFKAENGCDLNEKDQVTQIELPGNFTCLTLTCSTDAVTTSAPPAKLTNGKLQKDVLSFKDKLAMFTKIETEQKNPIGSTFGQKSPVRKFAKAMSLEERFVARETKKNLERHKLVEQTVSADPQISSSFNGSDKSHAYVDVIKKNSLSVDARGKNHLVGVSDNLVDGRDRNQSSVDTSDKRDEDPKPRVLNGAFKLVREQSFSIEALDFKSELNRTLPSEPELSPKRYQPSYYISPMPYKRHSMSSIYSSLTKLNSTDEDDSSSISSADSTGVHKPIARRSTSSSSLYSLLESRRQNVSKLRGLVIPEKPAETVVADLPTIAPPVSTSPTVEPIIESEVESITMPTYVNSVAKSTYDLDLVNSVAKSTYDVSSDKDSVAKSHVFQNEVVVERMREEPKAVFESSVTRLPYGGSVARMDYSQKSRTIEMSFSSAKSILNSKNYLGITINSDEVSVTDSEDQESGISSSASSNFSSCTPPMSPKEMDSSKSPLSPCSPVGSEDNTQFVPIHVRNSSVASSQASEDEPAVYVSPVRSVPGYSVKVENGCCRKSSVSDAKVEAKAGRRKEPVSDERWRQLEEKYGKSLLARSSQLSSSNDSLDFDDVSSRKMAPDTHAQTKPDDVTFKSIASRWEQRSVTDIPSTAQSAARSSPPVQLPERRRSSSGQISEPPKYNLRRNGSTELLDSITEDSNMARNKRSVSITDIRKAFEKHNSVDAAVKRTAVVCHHPRMSSLDSTASDSDAGSCTTGTGNSGLYGSMSSLASRDTKDYYGSISSLASSTSLISPQELQQLIDDANQCLEESGTDSASQEILVIVLHREIPGGSIGITLAGGADYETKEITVHKVICNSLADRDGRLQKGDRVLSINGKNLKGTTHREALNILKSPRLECVLVLSRNRNPLSSLDTSTSSSPGSVNLRSVVRSPRRLSGLTTSGASIASVAEVANGVTNGNVSKYAAAERTGGEKITAQLVKEASGLGFSLQGGKDSPLGNMPLTIKKIFTGGAADKNGNLKANDEMLSINNIDVTSMSRVEAWNLMKKLADGTVTLAVYRTGISPTN